ncbi:MAG: phosphonate degradation HD-domain oxygenase [Planctomycetota bacterium]|nr:phosphonate degradation HD-domain oxygenase [Planctomycetota bacterium]
MSATPESTPSLSRILEQLARLFSEHGGDLYGGESVTQLDHALQAAQLAQQQNRPASEIVSALLHDVGHLLHDFGDDCAERGIDDTHEEAGAAWLASEHAFSQCVTEPIRLHVPAKRFLCAVDPNYHSELSPASQLSLSLQGGPFTELEVAAFRETPYSEAAVRLRQWDDRAKDPGLETPSLDHFLALIDSSMLNEL